MWQQKCYIAIIKTFFGGKGVKKDFFCSKEITIPIRYFWMQHQLKYLAHICRMDAKSLRNQLLFEERQRTGLF